MRVAVIEPQQERLNELELMDTRNIIPYLCTDAILPENLERAGVLHPLHSVVIALTDDDNVNLAVAVAVKLMNPDQLAMRVYTLGTYLRQPGN